MKNLIILGLLLLFCRNIYGQNLTDRFRLSDKVIYRTMIHGEEEANTNNNAVAIINLVHSYCFDSITNGTNWFSFHLEDLNYRYPEIADGTLITHRSTPREKQLIWPFLFDDVYPITNAGGFQTSKEAYNDLIPNEGNKSSMQPLYLLLLKTMNGIIELPNKVLKPSDTWIELIDTNLECIYECIKTDEQNITISCEIKGQIKENSEIPISIPLPIRGQLVINQQNHLLLSADYEFTYNYGIKSLKTFLFKVNTKPFINN